MHPHVDPTLSITGYELLAWGAAVAFATLDVETTRRGFKRGAKEMNPLARRIYDRDGIGSLAALKLGAILGAAIIFVMLSDPQRIVVPIAISLPWGIAGVINCYTLRSLAESTH